MPRFQEMQNKSPIRVSTIKIQGNRDAARIWLEGQYLKKAGFAKNSKFKVRFLQGKITLFLSKDGDHRVSERRKNPIIDINTKKIQRIFKIAEMAKVIVQLGKIVLTKTKIFLRKHSTLADRSCGSVFGGGGPLDYAAKKAGFKTLWTIELEPKYADIWSQNHDGTMLNMSIEEVEFSKLQHVELLIAGIPCEPFSRARQNKDRCKPKDHEKYDLSIFFMMVVEAVNPRTIILEEVPGYLKSDIGMATMSALKRMGYNVHKKIFTGLDYGELETRKRATIVATFSDYEFPTEAPKNRKMGEILQHPDDPECEWWTRKTKNWVFDGWKKQKEKGNNFQSQIITANSKHINTITKRYWSQQYGNPVVKHQAKKATFRWLTLTEGKQLFGLPKNYRLGKNKTLAGEIIGQSVLVNVFKKMIEASIS